MIIIISGTIFLIILIVAVMAAYGFGIFLSVMGIIFGVTMSIMTLVNANDNFSIANPNRGKNIASFIGYIIITFISLIFLIVLIVMITK